MKEPFQIYKNIYQIGGPEITGSGDCCVYLIDTDSDLVLVDSGLGQTFGSLVKNIENLNFDLGRLRTIVVTHGHVDHAGSLAKFRENFGIDIVAHELDADRIETGRNIGVEFYGVSYDACRVDKKLSGVSGGLKFGKNEIKFLHIPGHTPGSIALFLDVEDIRVLFGQDIHGPYTLPGSDSLRAKRSLSKLIELEADILCEGHNGVYQPKDEVRSYIQKYLERL